MEAKRLTNAEKAALTLYLELRYFMAQNKIRKAADALRGKSHADYMEQERRIKGGDDPMFEAENGRWAEQQYLAQNAKRWNMAVDLLEQWEPFESTRGVYLDGHGNAHSGFSPEIDSYLEETGNLCYIERRSIIGHKFGIKNGGYIIETIAILPRK